MSSAFVDSGVPPLPPCCRNNGQVFDSNFYSLRNTINGDTDNLGLDRMDPNFGFSSPPLGGPKPGAGLSRPPRFAKLRKPLMGHRPSVRPVSQLGTGPGFEDSVVVSSRVDPGFSAAKPTFGSNQANVGCEFVFGSNDGSLHHTVNYNESNSFSAAVGDDNVETGKVVDDLQRLNFDGEKPNLDGEECFSGAYSGNDEENSDTVEGLNMKEDVDSMIPNKCTSLNDKVDGLGYGGEDGSMFKESGNVDMPVDSHSISGLHNSGFSFQAGLDSNISNCTDGHFKPIGRVPEMASAGHVDKKFEFSFTSRLDSSVPQHVEFKTPDPKMRTLFGLNRKAETKRELGKDGGLRKKKGKGKPKKPVQVPLNFQQGFGFQENMQEHTFGPYSPVELSPREETLLSGRFSRETSVASEESSNRDTQGESPDEDAVSFTESEGFKSAADELDCTSDPFASAVESQGSPFSRLEKQRSDGETQVKYDANLPDTVQSSFTFAASSSFGDSSALMRTQRKNYQVRVCRDSYIATPGAKDPHASSHLSSFQLSGSLLSSPKPDQKSNHRTLLSQRGDAPARVEESVAKQGSSTVASIAAQESCEKWRLRGNQAYAMGDFARAEDCYTQGVNCIPPNDSSGSCLRALMLCYSNRAATRMSLGRLRGALDDCTKASAIDPSFLKVQLRAAICYLSLGEVEQATLHFTKCLQADPDACSERKLLIEASEGLENAKKVAECTKQAAELFECRTSSDVDYAVSVISDGLRISPYSEKLLQMKADALLMLKKYEELIQFCKQCLGLVESNFQLSGVEGSDIKSAPSFRIWCLSLILKSYFYQGKLEEAMDFVNKQEDSLLLVERGESRTLESEIPLIATIHELLQHKAAGNEAYKLGKHTEAVEHYTAAISCSIESRPFAAICFCNRATGYRSMGQIIDAIADCCIAIALDENYYKAISRRAMLYEMIRDYGQAVADLQKLVFLLSKELDKKTNQLGTDCLNELRQARLKLSEMEEAARNEIPLNMYLILGVDPSASASEIKKAYRKAALKYHPDKVGQSLIKNESLDDGIWKEIAEEVHKDADRLFKMIGEAYAMLSDAAKRARYDMEEEMRNASTRGNTNTSNSTSKMYSDFHYQTYDRSNRRNWHESWTSFGNSPRGSETSRYNWYS